MLTKGQAVRLFTEPGLAIRSNNGGKETVYHVQSVSQQCFDYVLLERKVADGGSTKIGLPSCLAVMQEILSLDTSDAVIDIPSPLDEIDEHFGAAIPPHLPKP
jgi:hypothetical protein